MDCNMEYPACCLYFLGIHSRPKGCVYTKEIQVTCGIFHDTALRNVVQLVCNKDELEP